MPTMPGPITLTVLTILTLYILHSTYRWILTERAFRRFAASHGAAANPPTYGNITYGYRVFRRMLLMDVRNATGEDMLDDILAEGFDSHHTLMEGGGTVLLATTAPENMQAMFSTQFKDFSIGTRRRDVLALFFGESVFTTEGVVWRHSREVLRTFAGREVIDGQLRSIDEALEPFVRAMGPVGEAGWTGEVDLQPLLYNLTIDTTFKLLFGRPLGAQEAAMVRRGLAGGSGTMPIEQLDVDPQVYLNALMEVNLAMAKRFRLLALYWMEEGPKLKTACKTAEKTVDKFIDWALQNVDSTASVGENEASPEIQQEQCLVKALASQTADRKDLRNQCLAILFASQDTTGSVLGFCFLQLALHPESFRSLRSAILDHFKPGEPITAADLRACKPLQHFLSEILRLHSPIPVNTRYATKNTVLPVGGGADGSIPLAVRKGQMILYSVYNMHRRKDLWGEDAREFKPERWADEKKVPAWHFLPFLGGPRRCLGEQFAMSEAGVVIVRILQGFDGIEAVDGEELGRMRKVMGLTIAPVGVRVRLHRAG